MLISMPTGTSTIFGVFQDIFQSPSRAGRFCAQLQSNAVLKLRQQFIFAAILCCNAKRDRETWRDWTISVGRSTTSA
jgi:hypothetical protein